MPNTLALLNRRMQVVVEVGELKKHEGTPVFRPEREAQVIDGLKAINTGPLMNECVAPIWREIMSACRALETPTRVAYLGPAGTFSEEAALGFFGSSIVKVPCATFDEVLHNTVAGSADFGIVPVENSTEGVVTRSLDLFLTTPLFIIGETSLYVRHNLLRRDNAIERIDAVCAHPQALAQCHGWLSNHLPNAERRPVASNAEAARLAARENRADVINGVDLGQQNSAVKTADMPLAMKAAGRVKRPMVISVPEVTGNRYYSVQLIDASTNNYGIFGSRTSVDTSRVRTAGFPLHGSSSGAGAGSW